MQTCQVVLRGRYVSLGAMAHRRRFWLGGQVGAAVVLACVGTAFVPAAGAAPVTFDFEEFAATGFVGAHTSLAMARPGVNATVTRTSGKRFDIFGNFSSSFPSTHQTPTSWGSRSLNPFFDSTTNDGFLIDFDVPLINISIEAGDYGSGTPSDDQDTMTLTAYAGPGGTGPVGGTDSFFYGLMHFPQVSTVSATNSSGPIRSIIITGGVNPHWNSMFWDNLTVEVVTAPPPPCDSCCGEKPNFLSAFGSAAIMTVDPSNVDVVVAFDITSQPFPNWSNWFAPVFAPTPPQDWTPTNLGGVFGITLDDLGNIFVAHTTIYGDSQGFGMDSLGALCSGANGAGAIYKIDTNTGIPSCFQILPNDVINNCVGASTSDECGPNLESCFPGLGNLHFSCAHQMLYATNFEDGRIYQIHPVSAAILSTWHHASGTSMIGPPGLDANGFPDLLVPHPVTGRAQRVWAVQVNKGRLYYSTWREDYDQGFGGPTTRISSQYGNEIWSIALDPLTGEFLQGSECHELDLDMYPYATTPVGRWSNPVSDISFAPDRCCMLLAERSMLGDCKSGSHTARLHEYCRVGNACAGADWTPSGYDFEAGNSGSPNSCAGGDDYDHRMSGVKVQVWSTADAIKFGTEFVYGLIGLPLIGGTAALNALMIDADSNVSGLDKFRLGDVEITCPRLCDEPLLADLCEPLRKRDCEEVTGAFCLPTCVHWNGGSVVTALECDCRDDGQCHVEVPATGQPFCAQGTTCAADKSCVETVEPDGAGGVTICCCCEGDDLVIDLTTGVDDNGVRLPMGSVDDTWTAKACDPQGPAFGQAVVVNPHSNWSTLPTGQWISSNYNGPNGDYCYETCFCVNDGVQNPQLTFSILAADDAHFLVRNSGGAGGFLLFPPPNSTTPRSFSGSVPLVGGEENCIEVVVSYTGGAATGFSMTGELTADYGQCCPCPLENPTPTDPCASLQKRDCLSSDQSETCLPLCVEITSVGPSATECACADPGPCGPIEITPVGSDYRLSCNGDCGPPNLVHCRDCQVFDRTTNTSLNVNSEFASNLSVGHVYCCDCFRVPDFCIDGQFCNGEETCDANDHCVDGNPPCPAGTECDEALDMCVEQTGACCDQGAFGGCTETTNDGCQGDDLVWHEELTCEDIECTHEAIPTVSQWGLVVLTLLLLIGAKIYFARRETAAAS